MKLNTLKVIILIFVVSVLTGCVSTARPYAISGKYYMIGDSNCEKYSTKWSLTGSYINCFTLGEKPTGYRKSMSDEELQNYIDKATKPVFLPIFIPTYR